jgi:hypothetical protein
MTGLGSVAELCHFYTPAINVATISLTEMPNHTLNVKSHIKFRACPA